MESDYILNGIKYIEETADYSAKISGLEELADYQEDPQIKNYKTLYSTWGFKKIVDPTSCSELIRRKL
jgi:DNA/RNA-binding domain of Phe-tRNA-synthetase-like protein